jgi:hypothetical protein
LTINSGNFIGNLTGNITGSAASATNVASPDGDRNPSTKLPTTNARNVRFDFATSASIGGTGNYGGVMTYAPWDGTSASTGDSSYQLAFLNETGVNASGIPGLSLRNGINSTWNSWYRIITSGNIGSQSVAFATSSSRLYSTDSAYNYTSANPYYGYLTYDGTYWLFKVSPASPDRVRVYTADTLGGASANQSTGANTIVQRDANGYIQNSYFYTSGGGSERGTGISYIAGFNSSDYYIRSYTLQGLASAMSGATMNINGNAATANGAPWSGISSKPSNIMYYQGFTLDANTMDSNATGFTYSVNAPWTGPIARFSTNGGYDLQLNASYGGGGTDMSFRTRNGDAGTWNSWRYILTSSNYSSYALPLTGGTVTGVADFGTDGSGVSNTGIGIRSGAGGYGRIRFYDGGTNTQTIHVFNTGWGGFGTGNSGGAINLNGVNGVTFGPWNNCDGYVATGGAAWFRGDVTAYSDARVKDDVLEINNAIDKITSIRGVTFTRNDKNDGKRYAGVIAQEVLSVLPEVVTKDEQGMYSVAYGNMAGLFIEAFKEQQKQIEELKSIINDITK